VPEAIGGAGVAVAAGAQEAQIEAQESLAELTRIKGLGPKLAATLGELGVTRIEQIAAWDDAEIDRIDAQLGRFQGRIRRDNWVEQARLLAAGDTAGFESRFGSA
jgi:predicted flap endonuclease-1-like 5' DNA nuclease